MSKVATFLIACGALVLLAHPTLSQIPAPAEKPAPAEVKYSNGKLSVQAEKADLASLLKLISDSAGIGIVVGEGVHGSVSLVFTDVSLEDGINRILETAGERNFAATFGRVATSGEGGYRLERVAVLRKATNEPDESALPPDLDTTRPAAMFIDEKRLRYLGKGRVREPIVVLAQGEHLQQLLHQKKYYDSILIWTDDKKYLFRILDKQGNLVFQKEVPFGVNPSLVGNTATFVEPTRMGYRGEGEPILAGLTFLNFQGNKVAEVTPEQTGEITIRATTPEGLVIVNATGGLEVYDGTGKKLSHLPGIAYRSELSPDSKYIFTWEARYSDLTNGAYLYDLKGTRIAEFWGKREEGVVILAVSTDSRFFAYQTTDLETRERSTSLVDIQSLKVLRRYPILERDIAISDDASYIAAVGTDFPREKGSYIYPRYFRFYDAQGSILCEFSLGEDKGGSTPVKVTFVSKMRAKLTYGRDVYYFDALGEGR